MHITRCLTLVSMLALAASSGCSLLLEPDAQCEVDGDCQGSGIVCDRGLCVDPNADGGVPDSTDPYVLAYFTTSQSLQSDSLHLAYSTDGLNWEPLNSGLPVYTVEGIGTNHIRDPFILRKNDGTFVFIATDWTLSEAGPDYWNNPSSSLIMADSTDLMTFTNPRRVEVTPLEGPGGSEMHAWAPEAFFDEERQEYAIIWSGNDTEGRNRIYVSYTTDFQTLVNPTPEIFFDPGYSVIDGTVVPANGRNYLFFKDETDMNGGALTGTGKDVQIARTTGSTLAAGSFMRWDIDYITRGTNQASRRATEGPVVVKVPNQNIWFMCADYFAQNGAFGCWRTTDLDTDPRLWTELPTGDYNFPSGARHASIVRVTQTQLDAMIAHYGVTPEFQIRTTYSEGGMPLYVAHSYYRSMITTLDDRTDNQLEQDFAWKVVPGLADPSDPDLVSFEAVAVPGHYLRIDSQNPTRYPVCSGGTTPGNRGTEACTDFNVPIADRHHLGFIDPYTDTATYRSDVTFRRVPAQNGNSGMQSFQWYPEGTRYVRHIGYQIFAHPVSGATQQNDASFTLEQR